MEVAARGGRAARQMPSAPASAGGTAGAPGKERAVATAAPGVAWPHSEESGTPAARTPELESVGLTERGAAGAEAVAVVSRQGSSAAAEVRRR